MAGKVHHLIGAGAPCILLSVIAGFFFKKAGSYMKIIQRLYLKDFFRLLILIGFGLSFIFSLIDLIGKIDYFRSAKASFWSLGLYAFYSMPGFLLYLLPMSVLICSLFTFTQAFRRHEMSAIKAAGGRLKTLFIPFLAPES